MATHLVVPRPDRTGYDIEVTDANGGRHTMLGFMTKAEAEEWIDADRKGSEISGRMQFRLPQLTDRVLGWFSADSGVEC